MRRRDFFALLGGAVLAPPTTLRAQQTERLRSVGVLINYAAGDPEGDRRIGALKATLTALGWVEGRNLHIEARWGVDTAVVEKNAAELVELAPDVIVTNAPPSVVAVRRLTRTIPVVFAAVTDPTALGVVQSLSHPGGNLTGFSPAEVGLSAKWLELLKQIVPSVRRAAVFSNPANLGGGDTAQFEAIVAAAPTLGIAVSLIDNRDRAAIEDHVTEFAAKPDGGLIVLRTAENIVLRKTLIALAEQHRLPAVYPLRLFAVDGGLISYGSDVTEEFRGAAGYVDRILRGEKPADLPVQTSTKYELVINLKTAKAFGLAIPQTLLATADEVIE